MAKNEDIELEQQVEASPSRVWEALIRPGLWWSDGVRFDPRIGGQFVEPRNDGVVERRTLGRVTAFDAPHLLAMTWKDEDWDFETGVIFVISGRGKGTLISLRHRGWEAAPPPQRTRLLADHREGWSRHLGMLAACAASMTDKA